MVLVDDRLCVRAYRGTSARRYQAASDSGIGTITVGSLTQNVVLTPSSGGSDEIDAAYLARYGAAAAMVGSRHARAATLQIAPV